MVDTLVLETSAFKHGSSSLSRRTKFQGVVQLVECVPWKHVVAGSSPVSLTVIVVYRFA